MVGPPSRLAFVAFVVAVAACAQVAGLNRYGPAAGGSGEGAGTQGGGGAGGSGGAAGGGGAGGGVLGCEGVAPWAAAYRGTEGGTVVRVSALASDACETYVGIAADGEVEGITRLGGGAADGYVVSHSPDGERKWVTAIGGMFGQSVRAIAVDDNRVWIGGDNDGGLQIGDDVFDGTGGFVFALERETGTRIPAEDIIVRDDDTSTTLRVHDVALADDGAVHTGGEFGGQLEVNLEDVGTLCFPAPCGMWIISREGRAPDVRVFQAADGGGGTPGGFVVEDILVVGDTTVVAAQATGSYGGVDVDERDAVVLVYGGRPLVQQMRFHLTGSGEERIVGMAPLGPDSVLALVAHTAELRWWDFDAQTAMVLAPSQGSATVTAVRLTLNEPVVSDPLPWDGVLGQTRFANDSVGRRQIVTGPGEAMRAVGHAIDDANLDGMNAIDLNVGEPILFTAGLSPVPPPAVVEVVGAAHIFSEGGASQTLSHVALAGDHEVVGGYYGAGAEPVEGQSVSEGFGGFVIQRKTAAR